MSSPTLRHSDLSSPQPALTSLRLGILGGTFNPIHNGHIAIARQAREALGLDQILFIPAGDPPHKQDRSLAPAKDRYEMVRLAIASEATFALSDVEIRRSGKSYTVDTIRLLQQEYGPQTRLSFLIGLDAFLDLPSWREPETLLRLCSFVVISRPGLLFQTLATMALLPPLPAQSLADLDTGRISTLDIPIGTQHLTCLRLPPSEESASDIRMRIRQGLPVANQLPPLVESYILHHHLYE
jgi:nicotinate-nucleotide adenylyltransferase